MFDSLDVSTPVRVLGAIIILVALLGAFFWVVRWFGAERIGASAARGRQPRLAVIDAATVDGRRRLVLIRRDNVEHLLMIGGPSDLVVEPNIVRAAGAPREPAPQRPPATGDPLPRAVPLGEGTMWPLQPEPGPREPSLREPVLREPPVVREPVREPAPREPVMREPPMREPPMREPPRPQRAPPPPPPQAPPAEQATNQWTEPDEPPSPPPPRDRRPRGADPLAGLAEELARAPAQPPEGSSGEPRDTRPPRREPRVMRQPPAPPPAPVAAEPPFSSAADQNLAEMAQRLEAALRRPAKVEEPRFGEPAEAEADGATPARASAPAGTGRGEPRGRPEPRPPAGKSLYDSLEQEMASLLGRPDKKP